MPQDAPQNLPTEPVKPPAAVETAANPPPTPPADVASTLDPKLVELVEHLDGNHELAAGVAAIVTGPGATSNAEAFAKVVGALDDYKSSRDAHDLAVAHQETKKTAASADAAPRLVLHVGLVIVAAGAITAAITALVVKSEAPYFWAFFALAALTSLTLMGRSIWPSSS